MTNKAKKELITGAAGKLEVAHIWQKKADRLAIICHPHPLYEGTMQNKIVTTMARFCDAQSMHTVRFNFRGVGKSEGVFDNAVGEIDDALAVLAWASENSHVKQLWLAGFSFGGYIAAKLAEKVQTETALSHWQINKLTMVAPAVERYDMEKVHIPVEKTQLIYGDSDDVVKPDALANYANKKGITANVAKGVGHYFHGHLGDLTQMLEAFENK